MPTYTVVPLLLEGFVRAMEDDGKSSIGFEEGIVAAASYFCFLGLLILIIERKSDFVRFHAVQSTLGFGLLSIFWLAVKWISCLNFLVWAPGLIAFIFAVYMMIRALHGEEYKLPLIGNLAFGAVYETEPETEDSPPAETGDVKAEESSQDK